MKKLISTVLIGTAVTFTFAGCSKKAEMTNQTEAESTQETETIPESESEEETTNSAKNEGKPDFGPLSEDPYSFQLEIDGDVYQFPMTYKEFQSYGWVSKEDDSQSLDSGFRASTWVMKLGELQCYASVVNFDVNARPLNECYISGLTIDSYMNKKSNSKIVLPGGFELGTSSPEDLKAAYGTPSYDNTPSGGRMSIKYSLDTYQNIHVRSDAEGKVLDEIIIENIKKPENFQESTVSADTPEIISRYQAPEAVSDNFGDYTFQLDGKLYMLPAPVSQFTQDGWVILNDDADKIVSGRDVGRITLMKDNQQMRVGISNYSENATSVTNCFLIDVESEAIPLTISKGISLGMTLEEAEAALEGTDFEKDDSSSIFCYFNIVPGDSSLHKYVISVKKETNTVSKIKISFQPKYSDFTKK